MFLLLKQMGYIKGYNIQVFRVREAKDNNEFIIYNENTNSYNSYGQLRAIRTLIKETSSSGINIIDCIMNIEKTNRADAYHKLKEVFDDECTLIDNIGFKPINDRIYSENDKVYFNTYSQVETMNADNYKEIVTFEQLKENAIYTYKLLSNLHDNNDKAIKDTLLKIADKLRYPNEKPQDCIIFHPGEGSGKGIFFNYIIKPIFKQYSKKILMSQLNSDFNNFLKDPFVLVLEEGKANNNLVEVLKELVTEEEVLINEKGRDQIISKIRFLTFIFSNNTNPVNLGSRRGSYHNCNPLGLNERESCKIGAELVHNIPKETNILLNYLHNLEFKHEDSIVPFRTKIKQQVIDQNKTGIELFFDYIVQFKNLEESFNNIFGSYFNFNKSVYNSNDIKYISKDIIKDAYNKFCFDEGLNHNIVRHNKDIIQLWTMFHLKENDTKRFILKHGENSGRKLDHINLEKINYRINEVYESE